MIRVNLEDGLVAHKAERGWIEVDARAKLATSILTSMEV